MIDEHMFDNRAISAKTMGSAVKAYGHVNPVIYGFIVNNKNLLYPWGLADLDHEIF